PRAGASPGGCGLRCLPDAWKGVPQFHEWGNCDHGRHILIAVGRYLAAHFPTQRALLQTTDIASQLMHGGEVHREAQASVCREFLGGGPGRFTPRGQVVLKPPTRRRLISAAVSSSQVDQGPQRWPESIKSLADPPRWHFLHKTHQGGEVEQGGLM